MVEYNQQETAKYFDSISHEYSEQYSDSATNKLTGNYFRFQIVKELLEGLSFSSLFDAGCGSGDLLVHFGKKGAHVSGVDISDGMLQTTRSQLDNANIAHGKIINTPLTDLSAFDDESFDVITCLGVIPYIPIQDEPECYQEINRILKKGGTFISAHQNQLFDLFTFNKYTVTFLKDTIQNIAPEISENSLLKFQTGINGLIANPNFPNDEDKKSSQRGYVYTKSENPLTYKDKIRPYGFLDIENRYYNFHIAPPLILDEELKLLSQKMELSLSRDWKGVFMASTFINVAKKVA